MNNSRQKNEVLQNRGGGLWIALLVVLVTVTAIDAGALAWSASILTGRQVVAEMVTFFAVLSGLAITFWTIRAR